MPVTDLCEVIVAVLYPHLVPAVTGIRPAATALIPVSGAGGLTSPASEDAAGDDLPDAYAAITSAQRAQWDRIVGELTAVRAWGEDPLLHALEASCRRRDEIDEDIRLLITLGREFVSPRPYDYATLARASGLTQYLVRKAYGAQDIECIRHVTGLNPRKASDVQATVSG
ncbi:hypothetical protein [Streptomyces chartreusis]|uniref:Uncharacterized protein n=1 Tax=Streptomyces chartreusis TaxID=1969 RepID=A0A7H8TM25_STRCX|nr:hypothetical protein [Streptomyces chartreusis]QKZ24287.1 hypothetical protein HUT05_47270 [Streptomyces chartreusis]